MKYLTDKYERIARFCPALIAFLPIALLCWLWIPVTRDIGKTIISIFLGAGIAVYVANKVGDIGREKQKMLINIWGGFPTTKLLRHSDGTINKLTKQRYHQYLQENVPDINMPSEEQERLDPVKADEVYESAIDWLKEKARDKEKYYLVFNDNIQYGFSRNLWALKPIGLIVYILALIINCIAIYSKYISQSKMISAEYAIITGFLFVSIAVGIFAVTTDYVYKAGEKYAKSLLATCEDR